MSFRRCSEILVARNINFLMPAFRKNLLFFTYFISSIHSRPRNTYKKARRYTTRLMVKNAIGEEIRTKFKCITGFKLKNK